MDNRTEWTALYRLYDADDGLLYIGITADPAARLGQHAATRPWWPLVVRTATEWYETRQSAEAAEAAAIRAYDPYHNRMHSRQPAGNTAQDGAITALCRRLKLSRSDLVTFLLDREVAARGLLGDAPCYHSVIGWPDGVTARPVGWTEGEPCGCGRSFGDDAGARGTNVA